MISNKSTASTEPVPGSSPDEKIHFANQQDPAYAFLVLSRSARSGIRRSLAAVGTPSRLSSDSWNRILRRMPERPDPKEKKESCCVEHSQSALLRSVERRLDLDREYTDKVFKRLLLSINTQMASAEQHIIAKLEEIDTTLSIISREIARHTDDPQSEDVGHRH